MAIDVWWQGVGDDLATARVLCVKSTEAGQITCKVGGRDYIGDNVDPAVNNGYGRVVVSGLHPGTEYNFVLSVGSDSVSGSFKTIDPSDFSFCVASCAYYNRALATASHILFDLMPDFVCFLGDFIYMSNSQESAFGVTSTVKIKDSVAAGKSLTPYREAVHFSLRNPATLWMRKIPSLHMPDDHEWGGDDWDHEVYRARDYNSNNSYHPDTVQADCDDYWWAGNQAQLESLLLSNPTGAFKDNNDKPAAAQAATPASHYPVRYASWVVGDVRFILLDPMSYRTNAAADDNVDKTMLGQTQKQWFKDTLKTAGESFVVVLSNKKTIKNNGDNNDSWWSSTTPPSPNNNKGYQTELNELLDFINARSGWTNPNASVVWLTGDTHTASVHYRNSVKHICINGSAIGAEPNIGVDDLATDQLWMMTRRSDIPKIYQRNVAYVSYKGNYLDILIINGVGEKLWSGRIYAGENKLTYPQNKVSFG